MVELSEVQKCKSPQENFCMVSTSALNLTVTLLVYVVSLVHIYGVCFGVKGDEMRAELAYNLIFCQMLAG